MVYAVNILLKVAIETLGDDKDEKNTKQQPKLWRC